MSWDWIVSVDHISFLLYLDGACLQVFFVSSITMMLSNIGLQNLEVLGMLYTVIFMI
jgi:hypothetical protein